MREKQARISAVFDPYNAPKFHVEDNSGRQHTTNSSHKQDKQFIDLLHQIEVSDDDTGDKFQQIELKNQ